MDYEKLHRNTITNLQEMVNSGKITVETARSICADFVPETEDEKIRRFIKDVLDSYGRSIKCPTKDILLYEKSVAWLEKQGNNMGISEATKKKLEDNLNKALEKETPESWNKFLNEQGKQNHTDKIESKFKVGDWVVYDHRAYQVVELPKEGYINLGLSGNGKIEFAPSTYCRHWTIQNAKDGDALVASDGSIFIFKGTIACACKHYIALATDGVVKFNEGLEHYWETSTAVHPATKEQRDTLMKAMADAGYEWDAKNRQLRKIESRQEELTEFEKAVKQVMEEAIECGDTHNLKADADMLLRLVQKSSWSAEDEKIIETICKEGDLKPSERVWLKSLKERYTWRPSDKQMHYLSWIANVKLGDSVVEQEVSKHLNELLEDLKKLREE